MNSEKQADASVYVTLSMLGSVIGIALALIVISAKSPLYWVPLAAIQILPVIGRIKYGQAYVEEYSRAYGPADSDLNTPQVMLLSFQVGGRAVLALYDVLEVATRPLRARLYFARQLLSGIENIGRKVRAVLTFWTQVDVKDAVEGAEWREYDLASQYQRWSALKGSGLDKDGSVVYYERPGPSEVDEETTA